MFVLFNVMVSIYLLRFFRKGTLYVIVVLSVFFLWVFVCCVLIFRLIFRVVFILRNLMWIINIIRILRIVFVVVSVIMIFFSRKVLCFNVWDWVYLRLVVVVRIGIILVVLWGWVFNGLRRWRSWRRLCFWWLL